jgi:hypothetical protein
MPKAEKQKLPLQGGHRRQQKPACKLPAIPGQLAWALAAACAYPVQTPSWVVDTMPLVQGTLGPAPYCVAVPPASVWYFKVQTFPG